MTKNQNSTDVEIRGLLIIPEGSYLLTSLEEIEDMVFHRLYKDYRRHFAVRTNYH